MEIIKECRMAGTPSRLFSCKKKANIADNQSMQTRQAKLVTTIQSGKKTVQRHTLIHYGPERNLNYTAFLLNAGPNQLPQVRVGTTRVATEAHAWISPADPKQGSTTPPPYGVYADLNLIQGHLINAHLGGLAEPFNLFPITASMNAQHKNNVEIPVKSHFYNLSQNVFYNLMGYHLYYHVRVNNPYLANWNNLSAYATTFDCDWSYTDVNHNHISILPSGQCTVGDIHNPHNQTLNDQLAAINMGPVAHNHAVITYGGNGVVYKNNLPIGIKDLMSGHSLIN